MAEGARLESVFRGNSNVGSNPTLSAITFVISYLLVGDTYTDTQNQGGSPMPNREVNLTKKGPNTLSMAVVLCFARGALAYFVEPCHKLNLEEIDRKPLAVPRVPPGQQRAGTAKLLEQVRTLAEDHS